MRLELYNNEDVLIVHTDLEYTVTIDRVNETIIEDKRRKNQDITEKCKEEWEKYLHDDGECYTLETLGQLFYAILIKYDITRFAKSSFMEHISLCVKIN